MSAGPPPRSRARSRQVLGDLDRPLRRPEEVEDERHADGRVPAKAEQLLDPHREHGAFLGAVVDRDARAGRHLDMGRRTTGSARPTSSSITPVSISGSDFWEMTGRQFEAARG